MSSIQLGVLCNLKSYQVLYAYVPVVVHDDAFIKYEMAKEPSE
jgi:hypothetical protein